MATFAQQTTPDVNSPHILLMGPRRSGKSSIQRVVFYKMSPHETLFLESTNTLGSSKIFFPLFFFSPSSPTKFSFSISHFSPLHCTSPVDVLFFYFQNITDVKYVANNSLVQFQIWDFPGDFQFTDQVALGNQGMFLLLLLNVIS